MIIAKMKEEGRCRPQHPDTLAAVQEVIYQKRRRKEKLHREEDICGLKTLANVQ